MKEYIDSSTKIFSMLNGEVKIYPVCNTLQVNDYSKYAMGAFNVENKISANKEIFPKDLENVFKISADLSKR